MARMAYFFFLFCACGTEISVDDGQRVLLPVVRVGTACEFRDFQLHSKLVTLDARDHAELIEEDQDISGTRDENVTNHDRRQIPKLWEPG
jgi:hypothetical protein